MNGLSSRDMIAGYPKAFSSELETVRVKKTRQGKAIAGWRGLKMPDFGPYDRRIGE
jgi:hypothetical protein